MSPWNQWGNFDTFSCIINSRSNQILTLERAEVALILHRVESFPYRIGSMRVYAPSRTTTTGAMTDLRVVAQQFEVGLREELVVEDAVAEREPVTLQLPQPDLIRDRRRQDWLLTTRRNAPPW